MNIDGLDPARRVLIVAEIGNNHEGSFELAAELVGLAAEAGADAVKFQTFRTEHYVSPRDVERCARLRSFELPLAQFERLAELARAAGLRFISTPFDPERARGLAGFVDAFKIASGDLTFGPLLESVAGLGRPILLSTGLAELDEIATARALVAAAWSGPGTAPDLALLHCVSSYPVPLEQANLGAIRTLEDTFGGIVGYSDHALGIDVAVLAVAAGARIVEKHFTIAHDHSAFRDHQLSADPREMTELVRRVRETEAILGDGRKIPQPCERNAIGQLRRSIAAVRDLPAGTTIAPADLTWVRPADGLAPGHEAHLVGRTLRTAIESGRIVTPADCVQEVTAV